MRWDRVGRLAIVGVVIALVYLYVSAGISLLGAWHTSHRDSAKVAMLQRQNQQLKRRRDALSHAWVDEAEASRLGMAHPGEKVYVVHGLPRN